MSIDRAAKRIYDLDQLGMAIDWSVEGIAAIIKEEVSDLSERHIIRLDHEQFEALEMRLNGIDGAINRLSDNVGKWLAVIARSTSDLEAIKTAIDKADAELKGE